MHRDIKPSNILLGDRSGNSIGQVYLVDFGSVQTLASKSSSTMTVVGSYGYMAPEQFVGRATIASDLYSLGATLIYLVTGQHPGELPHIDLRIEFERFANNISPSFCHWLKRMTEPLVSQRFTLASDALQALEQLSESNSTANNQTNSGKPPGSKVVLTKKANSLQLIIPSIGFFHLYNFSYLLYSIFGFVIGLLFLYIDLPIVPVLGLMLLFVALWSCQNIFANIFGRQKLYIDTQKISLTNEFKLVGIEYHILPSSPRQHICRLERIRYTFFVQLTSY